MEYLPWIAGSFGLLAVGFVVWAIFFAPSDSSQKEDDPNPDDEAGEDADDETDDGDEDEDIGGDEEDLEELDTPSEEELRGNLGELEEGITSLRDRIADATQVPEAESGTDESPTDPLDGADDAPLPVLHEEGPPTGGDEEAADEEEETIPDDTGGGDKELDPLAEEMLKMMEDEWKTICKCWKLKSV